MRNDYSLGVCADAMIAFIPYSFLSGERLFPTTIPNLMCYFFFWLSAAYLMLGVYFGIGTLGVDGGFFLQLYPTFVFCIYGVGIGDFGVHRVLLY